MSASHGASWGRILFLALLPTLLALASTGCGTDRADAVRENTSIDTETFVEVYIALRRAAVETGDSTADFEARKRVILERHGVSGQDLLDYVERHGRDFAAMSTVWDTIYRRLGRRDTVAEH
jgi:hypothetical protein